MSQARSLTFKEKLDAEKQAVEQKAEADAELSIATLRVSTASSTKTNQYAGLTSAKKRKRLSGPNGNDQDDLDAKEDAFPSRQKKSQSSRGSAQSVRRAIGKVHTRSTKHESGWYKSNATRKFSRADLSSLKHLPLLAKEFQTLMHNGEDATEAIKNLRNKLHQMPFYDFITPALIEASKILEDGGLPMLFAEGEDNVYPWDIRDDSRGLFNKWASGDYDPHLLVGIKSMSKKNLSRAFEPGWPKVTCDEVGGNDLQNGTWWPLQLCAKRDGAHGEIEAGIHGKADRGAFSIVMSGGGGYDDVDNGEAIMYCGTEGTDSKIPRWTKYLMTAYEKGNPIRVLRSSHLPKGNIHRPSKGIRYDGLYRIQSYKLINPAKSLYQFSMTRDPSQSPIRWHGAEARPTSEELAELEKVRKFEGLLS